MLTVILAVFCGVLALPAVRVKVCIIWLGPEQIVFAWWSSS